MQLEQTLATCEPNNRESLLKALKHISDVDYDFNGNNGPEYRWSKTSEKNFKSNQDYVLNTVKDLPTEDDMVQTFIELWLKQDGYYKQYQCTVSKNTKGYIEAIAVAYIVD